MKELSQEAIRKMDPESRAQYAQVQINNKRKRDVIILNENADALRNSLNDLSQRVKELEVARMIAKKEVYPDFRKRIEALEKGKTVAKKSLLDLLLGK